MNMAHLFFILASLALPLAFAQQGAAKFQAPANSADKAAAGKPLNLAELSAKDTAGFETYSKRHALVQDSIFAMHKEMENAKKRTLSQMPALTPKDEFEKQTEYDARKMKWEKELAEKTARDTKPLMDRLAELEKAKKKIEENQASLYCAIDIKTNPAAASIYVNKEEIGASPAEYNLALPGYTVIRIQKENYEPWDTTLTLQPAQKLKLSVNLQEKSIFSKEGELNFPKLLAKDTTVAGYRERMGKIEARKKQVDEEMKKILDSFGDTYPMLEPQKPDETPQEFQRRQSAWQNEGMRQVGVLRQKHEAYKNKLARSQKVLEDYIITTESQLISETPLTAKITLGSYDVEKEAFEISVEDAASLKTPFHFAGKVGIPRDTAKAMNRSAPDFMASISYINYPFAFKDSSFNLAFKELILFRKAVPLKVEGGFKPLARFESMEGYGAWKLHADSLLSGVLKPQGLDLNYALKGEKAKEAANAVAKETGGESEGGGGLGWRGWTRIAAYTLAAGCGAAAVVKHNKAQKYEKNVNRLKNNPPAIGAQYAGWRNSYEKNADVVKENEMQRNIYGAGAGVLILAGTLTFFF